MRRALAVVLFAAITLGVTARCGPPRPDADSPNRARALLERVAAVLECENVDDVSIRELQLLGSGATPELARGLQSDDQFLQLAAVYAIQRGCAADDACIRGVIRAQRSQLIAPDAGACVLGFGVRAVPALVAEMRTCGDAALTRIVERELKSIAAGDVDVSTPIQVAATDADERVRLAIARGLAESRGEGAATLLRSLLADPCEDVRATARSALAAAR